MSPALNGSSVIWHFEGSDTIEIGNGITFHFYMGMPQLQRNEIHVLKHRLTSCNEISNESHAHIDHCGTDIVW